VNILYHKYPFNPAMPLTKYVFLIM